jgi:hypothetical protein
MSIEKVFFIMYIPVLGVSFLKVQKSETNDHIEIQHPIEKSFDCENINRLFDSDNISLFKVNVSKKLFM